jgi:cytochrome c oxidase assembly protein subunit 11
MLLEAKGWVQKPVLSHGQIPMTAHRSVVLRLLLVIGASVVFTLALVPLYNVLCQAAGLNGRVTASDGFQIGGFNLGSRQADNRIDRSRVVTVQFTGTVMPGLPWEVRSLTRSLKVHPGEYEVVEYLVRNLSGESVTGQAIPGVTPGQAARSVHKIECFCFAHQTMAPFEERRMAVAFSIRSDIDQEVSEMTLAYAFFPLSTVRVAAVSANPKGSPGSRS